MNTHYDFTFGRFAKGATLALGFGTVWAVVTLGFGTAIIVNSEARDETRRMETFRVAGDGTPLIESYPVGDLSRMTLRDLDGRELPRESTKGSAWWSYLSGEAAGRPFVSARMPWISRIKPFLNERDPKSIWYFVRDADPKGSGTFVGYERVSNRLIGRIGLAGLRHGPIPADERIPVSSEDLSDVASWSSLRISAHYIPASPQSGSPGDVPPRLVHVPSGNLLRVVDLDEGTVRTAFESPEPIASVAVPYLSGFYGAEDGGGEAPRGSILVRTRGRVFRLDRAYNVVATFDVPADVPPGAALLWYENRDGSAVVTRDLPRSDAFDSGDRRVMVYQVAADGAIRKETMIELSSGASGVSGPTAKALMGVGIPAPVPMLVINATAAANDPSRAYPAALVAMVAATLPTLVVVGLLAAALAWAAWRRGRVFGASTRERAAWTAFVALFGLPGWVGFRLHRAWPARAACPRCGAGTPRDRESCVACGEPFPEPAATGTEIFA